LRACPIGVTVPPNQAIAGFVARVYREGSPHFVSPPQRIAVSGNDDKPVGINQHINRRLIAACHPHTRTEHDGQGASARAHPPSRPAERGDIPRRRRSDGYQGKAPQ